MTEDSGKTKKIFDGRYEILSIVGRGSRSVVYHARHIHPPHTEVALKVLLARKDGVSNNERLRKEALAMVSSRHKYVIRLDDFHSLGSLCYLAMEYAPEADLRKYIVKNGGQLSLEQIEAFLIQILEGLSFIHQAGIIHRDLKPDNILAVNSEAVRIGDFGVAVLPGERASFEELQKGVGTMDYMAPEVLEGIKYDQCSDVYSLGVAFYEIITGKHPFRDVSMVRQLDVRRDENIADIRTLRPEVPEYLAQAITQAMSYDSVSRFASGKEFLQAILVNRSFADDSRPASRARRLTRGDREKLRSDIRTKKQSDDSLLKLEEELEAIIRGEDAPRTATKKKAAPTESYEPPAAAEVAEQIVEEPIDEIAPTEPDPQPELEPELPIEAPAAAATPIDQPPASSAPVSTTPDPYLSRWSKGTADGQTAPAYEQEEEEPIAEEIPLEEEEPAAYEEESELQPEEQEDFSAPAADPEQVGGNSRSLKFLLTIGLVVIGLVFGIKAFFSDDAGQTAGTNSAQQEREPESILPFTAQDDLAFPLFTSGVYSGVISGIAPDGETALTIFSYPERQELVVLLGIAGWMPARVSLADLASDQRSLVIRSSGISLELTGQNQGGTVSGYVRNIITHDEGAWRVQAIR